MSTYKPYRAEDHAAFLTDTLIPEIHSYSARTNHPPEAVALASLLALAAILQVKGMPLQAVHTCIDAAFTESGVVH